MHDRFLGLTLACLAVACSTQTPPGASARTGTRRDAIISGTTSGAEQDAVVLLYLATHNQTCTGTMVAPNLVVTARHCVADADDSGTVTDLDPSELRVFTGRDALSALRHDEDAPATVGKELVVPTSRTLYPDVAFIVLRDSLALPNAAMRLDGGVAVGETVGVIGYGIDESGDRPATRMQRGGLEVTVVGPARSPIGEPLLRGEVVFGEAACSGDSGGPAFSEKTGALVAIASRVGNGTKATADDPAAFCIGEDTDDVYTDLSPAFDVATRAFAAAGATPILEDSVAPRHQGELASANIDGASTTTRVSGDAGEGGGCRAAPSPVHTSPAMILLAFGSLALVLVDRRRTTRRRAGGPGRR